MERCTACAAREHVRWTGRKQQPRWSERHGSARFAFARLRLPSADLAEEAVQAALVGAWRSRGSFEGRSTERTWLTGILRYKILDLLRERSRRAAHETGPLADDADDFTRGVWASRPEPWHEHLGDDTDNAVVRRAVEEALAELPEPMRTALVLREIDGLPGKTVCEILGGTETNFWTMIHRAKARLRRTLADRFGEEWGG